MEKTYLKFIKEIKSKEFVKSLLIALFCVFVLAINYNAILLENNIVVGGVSGLAVILKKFISPSLFMLLANIILLIICIIFLGFERFRFNLVGSILFPIMVSLTAPLANFLIPYLNFDNMIITLIISALLYGFASGYLYKCGYSGGGGDIIVEVLVKYCHIPNGKGHLIINGLVLIAAGASLGCTSMVYGIIIVYISSLLIDKIMIGISDSKQFFIYTKDTEKVKDFIISELNCGVTLLNAKGGYLKDQKEIIMCVVGNKDYFFFKKVLLKVDPNVFFVICDCYEVTGGVKRANLPFI